MCTAAGKGSSRLPQGKEGFAHQRPLGGGHLAQSTGRRSATVCMGAGARACGAPGLAELIPTPPLPVGTQEDCRPHQGQRLVPEGLEWGSGLSIPDGQCIRMAQGCLSSMSQIRRSWRGPGDGGCHGHRTDGGEVREAAGLTQTKAVRKRRQMPA